jgi:hypothetical protein
MKPLPPPFVVARVDVPTLTLVAASAVALTVGAVYVYVGLQLPRRETESQEGRRALGFFMAWWVALGVNVAAGGVMYFAAAFGLTDLAAQVTYAIAQRLLLAVQLTGLMSYLLYLLTGRALWKPIGAAYAAYLFFLLYSLVAGHPNGVLVGAWRTELAYAAEGSRAVAFASFLVLLVPPVAAALAYLRLYPRMEDASQRYRIALVGGGILLWWVVGVIAGQRANIADDMFQLTNRFIGLAAAMAVLVAFRPPAWVQRRYHVRAFAAA